jgi:endonuclease/exonuclease/phosphatase family metal-dependent hydrolase
MRRLRVTTWNVLHRVHGVNWNEAPVQAFPDERERIAAISRLVARWLSAGVDVVCLQEVSGDQLASLRSAAGADVRLFEHTYPRVPRLHRGGAPPLVDMSEHLAVLTSAPGASRVGAWTFESDPGKGALAVEVGGVLVIDTHVSSGERRGAQLGLLAARAREGGGPGAAVLGDFNAPADVVRGGLGEGISVCDLAGQRPTRIETWEHPAKTIDHVAVRGGAIESASVLEGGGLSDHNPVTAVVAIGPAHGALCGAV